MRPLVSVEVLRGAGLPNDLLRFEIRIMMMSAGLIGEATGSGNRQTDISSRDVIQSVATGGSMSRNRLKTLAVDPVSRRRRTCVQRRFPGFGPG